MCERWGHWHEFGTKEYTFKHYRKQKSCEAITDIVAALQDIKPSMITHSFQAYGVAEVHVGVQVSFNRENERVAKVWEWMSL